MSKIKFILPKSGIFKVNGPSDPLDYYYRPLVGKLYVKRIQMGLDLLNKEYDSILEFGSGSGLLLPTLNSISNNLTAVDLDADTKLVKESLDKLNINAQLYQEDITTLNLESNSFNLIVAFSVFEHIKEPDQILKELHRILKPGGELLVGMPRVDKFMEKLFVTIGFNEINDHHVTNYKEFLKFASKEFELEKINTMPKFLPKSFGLYFNILLKK
ncbi:class I SAM-dependent methyltransferase [bacterium]|jgi:ubiquinone/menaquinone biosynthesis C-methylase UbiE|nr:class I SAM-dependent methyltransferase [bacterium]MBT4495533.1 class I SAM-dependent methyltransferase [bacterium]MBT4764191.1 class I SAM-dependent methyltransferase [bacterium]MBT5401563.1 class I SAM-dependent methyltransferase [bacterium]MBT5942478.1 class I SAM-dependent methyltransferase [bacterium]